jgi:uncharacterized membrane protein required for colicin V production
VNYNLLDFLCLAYIGISLYRGRRAGLAAELPGLVSITAALVAGGGLFHWSERLVTTTATLTGQPRGLGSFLGILVATIIVWRAGRARIRQWAANRFPDAATQRRGGMVAGGLRAAGVCALLFLLASTLPVGEFRKPFTRGSLFGSFVMKVIRPAYAAATR